MELNGSLRGELGEGVKFVQSSHRELCGGAILFGELASCADYEISSRRV